MAEIVASSLPTPAAGDGSTDDSAAFNSALAGTTVLLDGTKTYMVTNLTLANNVTLRGVSGSAKLKKVAASTTTYMFNLSGTNQRLENLTIDGAGIVQTTSNKFLLFGNAPTNLQIVNCIWINSGTPDNTMGAILAYNCTATIDGNRMTDSTVTGTQIKVDGRANKYVKVCNNVLVGSQSNGIYITNSTGGYTSRSVVLPVEVCGNYIKSVTDGFSGTGQTGNAIVIYQADGVQVHHNQCISPRFTGVRVNSSADVQVQGNYVDGAGESSMYAELGAIGCQFIGNKIMNFVSGINLTNISQRSPEDLNFAYHNDLVNGIHYGIKVEHDVAKFNRIDGCPFPILIGFGSSSHDNHVFGNIITRSSTSYPNVIVPISIDRSMAPGDAAETVTNNILKSGVVIRQMFPMSFPDAAQITAITNATAMVVSYSNSTNPTPAIGQVWGFAQIGGMTELNGQTGTITAVNTGSKTMTFGGIDSSAYGSFTSPTGGQKSSAVILYASGTTPHWSIPTKI